MDQVKMIFAILHKQLFWVICGIVTITATGAWYVSAASLAEEEKKNSSQANSIFNGAKNLAGGKGAIPNDVTAVEMDKRVAAHMKSVRDAWEVQFEDQKHVLVWPTDLSETLRERVEPLRPIETAVPYEPGKPDILPPSTRELYRDFIDPHIPKLADRIRAKWLAKGARPLADGEVEPVYIVEWSQSDQAQIQARLTNYADKKSRIPTTLEILYTQEDLWIYQALLDIVQRTNGDVSHSRSAKIKAIDYIRIGRDVIPSSGQIERLDRGKGAAKKKRLAGSKDPAGGRYVTENYTPMTGEMLRNGGYAVAKRMPVQLGFLMDQREIDTLLVECGNSPLPVEVQQVRINVHKKVKDNGKTFDRPVEIFGIIYIYNEPDDATLSPAGDDSTGEGTPPADGAPAGNPDGGEPAP